MKIGVVTFWYNNYGSMLQCFATCRALHARGYEPIVLQRREQSLWGRAKRRLRYRILLRIFRLMDRELDQDFRWLAANPARPEAYDPAPYRAAIERFARASMDVQELSFSQLRRRARKKELAACLCGSDQIFSSDFFVPDPFYFLCFAPRKKRFAMAPSFGSGHIYKGARRNCALYLQQMALLSCREPDGAAQMRDLTARKDIPCLIDPVLQFDGAEWRQILRSYGGDASAYAGCTAAFFLDAPCPEALSHLTKAADAGRRILVPACLHPQLTALPGAQPCTPDPMQWLAILDGAAEVCTDSYHAMLFCSLFHTSFLVFDRQYRSPRSQAPRIRHFLQMTGLEARFVTAFPPPKPLFDADFAQSDAVLAAARGDMAQYWDKIERKISENRKKHTET